MVIAKSRSFYFPIRGHPRMPQKYNRKTMDFLYTTILDAQNEEVTHMLSWLSDNEKREIRRIVSDIICVSHAP